MKKCRNAFTLIEILIVVVIMAVLAATIIPQFTDSSDEARTSTVEFNLNTMRGQVELYKGQHDSLIPGAALTELTSRTDRDGTINAAGEYGPYVFAVPENTVSGSNAVKTVATATIVVGDVTADGTGGWIYSTDNGNIWIDHPDHWQK